MNLIYLEEVIYSICENNDIKDADELDELHHKIVDTVADALVDYADDNYIEDFDISLF